MLDLSWINEQIDRLMNGTRCMQSARDLAALIIVRDEIQKGAGSPPAPSSDDTPPKVSSPSVLSTVPTLDQVQRALGAVVINTPEDRQRAQDIQTWLQILSENT